MTDKAGYTELSWLLGKAIAYRDSGKPEKAAEWTAELVRCLEAQEILAPVWRDRRPA